MKYFSVTQVLIVILLSALSLSCDDKNEGSDSAGNFNLTGVTVNALGDKDVYTDADPQNLLVTLSFSEAIDPKTLVDNVRLRDADKNYLTLNIAYDSGTTKVTLRPRNALDLYSSYTLLILPGLKSAKGSLIFTGKTFSIATSVSMKDKFTRIPTEDLLTLVQKQTFKYFWDFAHPVSGMARERSSSGDVVTSGGTGFGIMAMLVAAERGFITREEALLRIQRITAFLDTKCTKYHGAFAHWINGNTGETIPFSQYDDGADLVETAFLFQGLLTAKQYFSRSSAEELQLRADIDRLWRAVEWTWFRKGSENALYWHWSPKYAWQMNMKISGWNEALIVYVLAASSPTYPITKDVYKQGWTRNGSMANGKQFYGYNLPLGEDYGGPLFFSHYSFLGLNPKGLSDGLTDFWTQNRNHTLINYKYCIENPKKYSGYSASCWGLTASDENNGYAAHSPSNDNGVITPTAALSSMPYTPEESLKALDFFYYILGDRLWKEYGFVDAFNLSQQWFSNQFLAIDQGPIIIMIENYRSGLLWKNFMSNEDVKSGLTSLGFQSNP